MLPRRPFLVALKMTLVGAAVALVAIMFGPTAFGAIGSYRDSISQAASDRAFDKALGAARPAIKTLRGLRLPPGLRDCSGGSTPVGGSGLVCWRGTRHPVVTTAQIVQELKRLGATNVSARCLQLRALGQFCSITATIRAQPVSLSFGPDTTQKSGAARGTGVFVSGGVGPGARMASLLPHHGTPIPVPE